ncbi:NAD(+)--dinitrogen-reductase ADP-D-ribosyltransferase [Vibrio hannami]|uniref:NAD(+)--dinitrogen-reductase ADP-D-ribosyltransferase n=1 Tax=Vibrio hannami TaxID=2717094 RepID=UPI00240F42E1|nr:NAD(+)--dinitrogen-reductase ADP-D-ribosyltransferase [Vibrio hannami]MDG3085012.1 NAD(+)--dinitrogen-reductase ADP-D-ribosyltransferase [Vibrio hannami]
MLASLSYQQRPIPIDIDNLQVWNKELFQALDISHSIDERVATFQEYMQVRFRLSKEDDRFNDDPPTRAKVDYKKLLLGWLFDSDNEQGAAWRSWVESRFGLITRYHGEPIGPPDSESELRFRQLCAKAIHNTNELYSQLDALYQFCQHELNFRFPSASHLTLYRGCADLPEYSIEDKEVHLFNNLSSLTSDPESALRFGTKVYEVRVPKFKVVCFDSLLPGSLNGEQEYMVLGGLYQGRKVNF